LKRKIEILNTFAKAGFLPTIDDAQRIIKNDNDMYQWFENHGIISSRWREGIIESLINIPGEFSPRSPTTSPRSPQRSPTTPPTFFRDNM